MNPERNALKGKVPTWLKSLVISFTDFLRKRVCIYETDQATVEELEDPGEEDVGQVGINDLQLPGKRVYNYIPIKQSFFNNYVDYLGVFEVYSSTNLVTTTPMVAMSLKLCDTDRVFRQRQQ